MNIDHLRKQAKNLRRLWPDLVQQHGSEVSLTAAQDAIARIHGFPEWRALAKTRERVSSDATRSARLADSLIFALDQPTRLPIRYSSKTGNPTRYAEGVEAILRPRTAGVDAQIQHEEMPLDEAFERALGGFGDYASASPAVLAQLLALVRASLARCEFCVETYSRFGGLLFTLDRFDEALAVIEPVANELLAMVPTTHPVVQVPYGYLENRPFFRLCKIYVLLLDKVGRHGEADTLAKQMLAYCPNDNVGFRFLLSRRARAGE